MDKLEEQLADAAKQIHLDSTSDTMSLEEMQHAHLGYTRADIASSEAPIMQYGVWNWRKRHPPAVTSLYNSMLVRVERMALGTMILVAVNPQADLKPGAIASLARFKSWTSIKSFTGDIHSLSDDKWASLRSLLREHVHHVTACGGQHRQAAITRLLTHLKGTIETGQESLVKLSVEMEALKVKVAQEAQDQSLRVQDHPAEQQLTQRRALYTKTFDKVAAAKAVVARSGWWLVSVYDICERTFLVISLPYIIFTEADE